MELLIFNKPHYMDSLTLEEIAKIPAAKYNARYQRGDVVERRLDGFWNKRGCGKESFSVVKVPGVEVTYDITKPLEDLKDPENPVTLKRRQYNVDTTKLLFDDDRKLVASSLASAKVIDKNA